MVELLPLHASAIIVASVTGGTQTDELWCRVVRIVVAVRGMQVDDIHDSGSFGDPFRSMFDLASDTTPACQFLTLLRLLFPIFRITLSPFAFHRVLLVVGKYPQVVHYQ